MRKYDSEEYKAMMLYGSGYLSVRGRSVQEIRDLIDEANERAVQKGYPAEQYRIIHVETSTWLSNGGTFVRRETFEKGIETYPNELAQTNAPKDDEKKYLVRYFVEDYVVGTETYKSLRRACDAALAMDCESFTVEDSCYVEVRDPDNRQIMVWLNNDGERGTDCERRDPRYPIIEAALEN